jgi:hypothetical protein
MGTHRVGSGGRKGGRAPVCVCVCVGPACLAKLSSTTGFCRGPEAKGSGSRPGMSPKSRPCCTSTTLRPLPLARTAATASPGFTPAHEAKPTPTPPTLRTTGRHTHYPPTHTLTRLEEGEARGGAGGRVVGVGRHQHGGRGGQRLQQGRQRGVDARVGARLLRRPPVQAHERGLRRRTARGRGRERETEVSRQENDQQGAVLA